MLRRATAAVLLSATLACYSVKRVSEPGQFIQTVHPENVWVAAENGEIFRLSGPQVKGDSVVGTVNGTTEPMALSIDGNNEVFARQKDPLKTLSLVGSIGLVSGLAVYGFLAGGSGAEVCDNNPKQGGRPTC